MYKNKFFFIVFEGIEGTGKSFQIHKLYKNLKSKNLKVIKTREPGGSRTAEKIRNLIFSKKSGKFNKLTDYYLMLASRNEHLLNTILPAKKKRAIVISDRFIDSTHAYQVIGKKIDNNLNKANNKYILGSLKPSLTIVLKSNFKSINRRLKKRANKNKFDKLKRKFYLKAQKAYINIANKNKKNYFIFDSSKNDKSLEQKIFKLILKKLS